MLGSACDVALSLASVRTGETFLVLVVGSLGHGGSRLASEGAASLDPCIVSSEATEPKKLPHKASGPESSPLPSPPAPWEQECPPATMPFAEGPLEACLVSPAAAPTDGPFTVSLAEHPRSSPNAAGDTLAGFVPQGDSPPQDSVVADISSAGREEGLKEGGQTSTSSSSMDLSPGMSPAPPRQPAKGQLCGEDSQPGGFESQGKEAAGGFSPPEPGKGAPQGPPEAQSVKEDSAGLEESLSKSKTPTPQDSAPRSSDRGKCLVEVGFRDVAADSGVPGACAPTGSSPEAAPEAKVTTVSGESCQHNIGAQLPCPELPQDLPRPALAPGAGGSWRDTPDAGDTQQHSPGTRGIEPSEAICVPAGDQPAGALLMSTEDPCPALSPTSQTAAQAPVAAGEPSRLAREMVSGAEMHVLTDLAKEPAGAGSGRQGKHASDLGGEGGGPDGSSGERPARLPQKEQGELWDGEQSLKLRQGVLPPPPSASDESARSSLGPEDEAKAPVCPDVAKAENKLPGADPTRQEEALESPDGADPGDPWGEQPQAFSCKPTPVMGKDEVSKLTSDMGSKVLPSRASAQPLRKEEAGHTRGPASPTEAAAHGPAACGMLGEARGLLDEQDPVPPPGPDGAGEHVIPEGAVRVGPGLQPQCPETLQDVGGPGRMDSLPALESETPDFLSTPAAEVVPEPQEVESSSEIQTRSRLSEQEPGSCDGEGLLTSPQAPGLGHDAAGQEVQAERPHPPEGESLVVDCGLTVLSPEQDQQGNLSCPGDSGIQAAVPKGPPVFPESHCQPFQSDPDASVFDVLRQKAQPCDNEKEASPGGPGLNNRGADSPQTPGPMGPQRDVGLPTHGGEELASGPELQSERPVGSLPAAAGSAPTNTGPGRAVTERPDVAAPAGSGQEEACPGRQPPEVSPAAAGAPRASPLAGGLSGRCAGQGLSASPQEPVAEPKASGPEARPPPRGSRQTEKACGSTAGAPPCLPDSVALPEAAPCLPAPAPASPGGTPTRGAPDTEACDETPEGRRQPVPAPQEEMECPAAADAEAQRLLGSFPPAQERGAGGGGADEGDLGRQRAPEGPGEAALRGGFLQAEQRPTPGEQAPSPVPGEPGHADQPSASRQDPLPPAGELGGSLRSTGNTSAAQAVPNPGRLLLPPGSPEEAVSDTPYLHIDGAARTGAEDGGVTAGSSQGPRGPGESPCPTGEALLALENAASGKLSAGPLASLPEPGAAGAELSAVRASSGSPGAGPLEGPVDSVPYLDRMPRLASGQQTTGEKKAASSSGVDTPPRETPAFPAHEEGTAGGAAGRTESSAERMREPSQDPRNDASRAADTSPQQTSMVAGFPDFREHITKIFEKSVLGPWSADRPQRTLGERAGAARSVAGKDLAADMSLSPEKLPDGVAVAPLPAPPTGLWPDSKEKRQEGAVEVEISHLVAQDAAPDKLPGLGGLATEQSLPGARVGTEVTGVPWMLDSEEPAGAGEAGLGLGGQAHPEWASSGPEPASGLSAQAAAMGPPAPKAAGLPVAPQSHQEVDLVQDDRIPSGRGHQETSPSNSRPGDDAGGSAHMQGPDDLPVSTSAWGPSPPRGDAPIVPEAVREPPSPDTLEGEKCHGGAAGVLETQNALGNQIAPEPAAGEVTHAPLGPGLVARAAGEAEGDITLSTAETGTRVSGDLPETDTTRMLSGVPPVSTLPGSSGDPGMEAAATLHRDSPAGLQQPRPEPPMPTGDGKGCVSSPPEPDATRDPRPQKLAPGALQAERYLKA